MRSHYGTDPKTGRKALYITKPDGKMLFIWNTPPKRRSLLSARVEANDTRPLSMTSWAAGRSYEQRLAVRHAKGNRCEHCGQEHSKLTVHHPRRLVQHRKLKQGPANIIQSAQDQQTKLLCPDCHLQHHHGTWN